MVKKINFWKTCFVASVCVVMSGVCFARELGSIIVPAPTKGTDGQDGASAYQIWLANGHEGTEADFLAWLKGAPGTPACNTTLTKSVITNPVTNKKSVTITATDCYSNPLWTETVEDGTDGTPGASGATGVGVCDNVADTATANKNTVSIYTAGTATTIGYMTHTYTKCNGNIETSVVEDSCTQVVDKRTSDVCSGAYMVCKNQQAGTEYNVCKPISGQNVSPFGKAISDLASELDQKASKNTLNNYVKTDGTNLPSGVITTSNLAQNNIVTTSALNSAVNTAVGTKAVSFGGETMTLDDVVELLSSAVTCTESDVDSVNTISCSGNGLNLSRSKVTMD